MERKNVKKQLTISVPAEIRVLVTEMANRANVSTSEMAKELLLTGITVNLHADSGHEVRTSGGIFIADRRGSFHLATIFLRETFDRLPK